MKLADNIDTLFGKVTPPPGSYNANPVAGLGKLLATSIQLFLATAAMATLVFLLWGGFDWVTSGGEREKVEQAQQKITNALLGLFVVIGALTVFTYVTGNLFGVIRVGKGFKFNIPTLQDIPAPGGSGNGGGKGGNIPI